MAIDWTKLLSDLTYNVTTSGQPLNSLVGGGLIGAGLAQQDEPGYAVEARQSVRGLMDPESQTNQFTHYVNALNEQYQPLLTQQRNRGIADIQQKFIAAFPKTVGAQGPEFGALSRYITDEALPREQAVLGDLGLKGIDTQLRAGQTLLNYAKPDPLGAYLATLGTNLLSNTKGGVAGQPSNALSGNPGSVLASIGQMLGQAVTAGGSTGEGTQLIDQLGRVIGVVGQDGTVTSLSKGIVGNVAQAAGGAGAALGPALGLAGTAAAGYGTGQLVSKVGQNQFQSSAGGALAGAATGAAIGSVVPGIGTAIGAIVGGIAGLFGGLQGEQGQQAAQKAAFRKEDLDSQADQVQEIGTFFSGKLRALGVDAAAFEQFVAQQIGASDAGAASFSFGGVSGVLDQQLAVAQVGGKVLLEAIRQADPSITSLAQVPGLKQAFIDYLTRSTFSASNGSYGGGAPLNQFDPWAGYAGLAKGGYITRPNTLAFVGEDGPELAMLQPGSMVIPMRNSLN